MQYSLIGPQQNTAGLNSEFSFSKIWTIVTDSIPNDDNSYANYCLGIANREWPFSLGDVSTNGEACKIGLCCMN